MTLLPPSSDYNLDWHQDTVTLCRTQTPRNSYEINVVDDMENDFQIIPHCNNNHYYYSRSLPYDAYVENHQSDSFYTTKGESVLIK